MHRYPDELRTAKRRQTNEDKFQIALVEHIKWRRMPGVVCYMIPNHGKRSRAAAGKAKAMGLLNGAADLAFVLPPNGLAAFLELKHGQNTASTDQIKFADDVQDAGAFHAIAWDIDTALRVLEAWGAIKPEAE